MLIDIKLKVDNLMKENNLLAHGISCWQGKANY